MKSTNQLNWVKEKLNKDGKVSRNQALSVYISRLGAYIEKLRKDGWEIESKSVKENGGTNFYYFLTNKPKQLKIIVENGRAIPVYV
jgi:hypothetical protein